MGFCVHIDSERNEALVNLYSTRTGQLIASFTQQQIGDYIAQGELVLEDLLDRGTARQRQAMLCLLSKQYALSATNDKWALKLAVIILKYCDANELSG